MLVFGGKRLRGDRSLSDYCVQSGDSLALAPRPLRRDGARASDATSMLPDAADGQPPPASGGASAGGVVWD